MLESTDTDLGHVQINTLCARVINLRVFARFFFFFLFFFFFFEKGILGNFLQEIFSKLFDLLLLLLCN